MINKNKNTSEKPITWRNLADDPHIRKALLDIINSAELNKKELDRYIGWNVDDDARIINVWKILTHQYSQDLSEILDKSDVVGFLNRFAHSYCEFIDARRPEYAPISSEELDKFRQLAAESEKISKEQLSEISPMLTVNSYLKMCRIVYDATSLWKYPDDVSTEFLFCKARLMNSGFYGIDRDSPEEFANSYRVMYHPAELWFGGPWLYIYDESVRTDDSYYIYPKVFGRWTGRVACDKNEARMYRAVKMYIALRESGYPLYFGNYESICDSIVKTPSLYIERNCRK